MRTELSVIYGLILGRVDKDWGVIISVMKVKCYKELVNKIPVLAFGDEVKAGVTCEICEDFQA